MPAAHNRSTVGSVAPRRDFIRVGVVGSLSLTLGDYFALQVCGDQKIYESKEGPAKSVIRIVLPRGYGPPGIMGSQARVAVLYRGGNSADRIEWRHQ